MWKLNNIHLKKQWVKEDMKREIRKHLVMSEIEHTKFMRYKEGSA